MKSEIKKIADEMHSNSMVARDWVFQVIRTAIIRGVLPCNMPLRQDEISDALNISHIPVREAFRQLEAYGLLKIYPNRGAVVCALTEKEFSDMSNVLFLLEKTALEAAVDNITDEQIANIGVIASSAASIVEPQEFSIANMKFHLSLCQPAQNQTLLLYLEQLRANLDRYLIRTSDTFFENAILVNEHNLIIDAYTKRNKAALSDIFIQHFEHEKQIMQSSSFFEM